MRYGLCLVFCAFHCLVFAQSALPEAEGRWDLTFDMDGSPRPGWLEIERSGNHTLVGRIMVIGGSARPISEIAVNHGQFSFSIPAQWDAGDPLVITGSVSDSTLKGEMRFHNGKTYAWTGVRAPKLRHAEPQWGKPIVLFDGTTMNQWTTQHVDDRNQWVVEDNILRSAVSGANLMTRQTFDDFKLHIEFRYPENGNSGVYLRGRYEVQVFDSKGKDPESHLFGGIYGLLDPSENAEMAPGEWQSFDITLVGRMVTVIANGTKVICNQEIPGITGGAIDSHESEPGPILLQGDHQPIEYRNIVLIPALKD